MKILVTGGAGFIGSHLCERLMKRGYEVVAVDNFESLYSQHQKEENLAWLISQTGFAFIRCDVRQMQHMAEVFSKHKFDYVFHFAGRGGIPQSTADPFLYLDEIMTGTMVMLELSAKNNVQTFINASSSSVYGNILQEKSSERSETDKPLSVYAALKKSSELLCHSYHVQYDIGVVNARFFSVYGPRGRPDQIIYKVTRMIDTGTPIPVIRPDPQRDFTYISDIVDALEAILLIPPRAYETINFGYGQPETIGQVIRLVEKGLGKKAVLGETRAPTSSDTAVTYSDSAHAQKILGWRPHISLEQGIAMFLNWYQRL